ncbi:hypothetical protein QPK87_13335 [Kamptonema cortianum]|nr:hypothetical protein [Geitlerinema splendidum]MDK3157552.1 hypothetical protein [Kamptonema cortianum]
MRFPSQRSMFNFNLPAYATWENFVQERDQYSFSPGHTYMRFSEQLESWNYIDHFQSLMEGQVERFEGGYYVPGSGIYGVTRLLALLREDGDTNEMNVTLKYRWASDGTLAKSARQIRIVPSYQSIAVSSPFFDNEDPTRPQALSGWVDGSRHEVTISDVDPLYHFIGQATLSLIGLIPGGGTWAAVRAALGIGLSASATVGNATQAVFNRDPDRLYQGEGLAIGPANWRDYEMGGTGNWRDVLEHFNWRVYYVPEKLVKLEAFDLYGLSGFLGQTVVEHVEQRDKRVCQRQFRFWHSLAPEKPQN